MKTTTISNKNEKKLKSALPSESALRRKARRQGFRLIKVRDSSRFYDQYGPYIVADATTNVAIHHAITAEEVNDWLADEKSTPTLAGVVN